MRIVTLKLPNGNLGFKRPIPLERAREIWMVWLPLWMKGKE